MVRLHRPAIGLHRGQRVLCSLLGVLDRRLGPGLLLADEQLAALPLLFRRTSCIDGAWQAVCALMYVGDQGGRFVVADYVLPGVALLTQHRVAVVVGETADTLDRGRLFFINRTREWRRRRAGARGRCRGDAEEGE